MKFIENSVTHTVAAIFFSLTLSACGGGSDALPELLNSEFGLEDCARTDITITDEQRRLCDEGESEVLTEPEVPEVPEVPEIPEVPSFSGARISFSSESGLTACGGSAAGPAGTIFGDVQEFPFEDDISVSVEFMNMPEGEYEIFLEVQNHQGPRPITVINLGSDCQSFVFDYHVSGESLPELPAHITAYVIAHDQSKEVVASKTLEITGDVFPDINTSDDGSLYFQVGDILSRNEVYRGAFRVGVIAEKVKPAQLQCILIREYDIFTHSWQNIAREGVQGSGAEFSVAVAGLHQAVLLDTGCDSVVEDKSSASKLFKIK